MFDLKCKRQSCKYNKNCNCTAHRIEVDKQTACTTYKDCGVKKTEKDEIKQSPTRKNITVKCNANCLFNESCDCKANGISVLTNDKQPECSTFMPK